VDTVHECDRQTDRRTDRITITDTVQTASHGNNVHNVHVHRFFSQANDRIAIKLTHDGLQVSLRPRCAQGQGQGKKSRDTGTFVLARTKIAS